MISTSVINPQPSSPAASTVVPLPRSSIGPVAGVIARAFEHDPMFTFIFPAGSTRRRSMQRFFAAGLRYGVAHGAVHTTTDLAGCALWLTPEHPDITVAGMVRSGMVLLPLTIGPGAFRRFTTFVGYTDAVHKQVIGEPHWYLLNLGVEPARQGHGIGSALLQPVLALADARQQPCYLETNSQRNVRFYERHGFEVARHGRIPSGGPPFWALLRPARRR